MLRSGYWQSLTTIDFAELDVERTVAVLPVGAVEQHGPHLPLATDSAINAGIVAATLPRLGDDVCALVLPAASVGHSIEHEDYRGTLSIAAENLLRVWLDLGRNVATAGIRKLVIFNTHGGQRALVELAAVRLRVEHAMLVARTSYTVFGAPEGLFSADEWRHGIHGGEIETSLMLHLHPELVRLDALRDFENRAAAATGGNAWFGLGKPAGLGWKAQDLNPAGVCGDAASADAVRGKRYLEHLAESFATLLVEVADTPLALIDG